MNARRGQRSDVRSLAVRFGNDNHASARGLVSELFLAFVPNLFVSWANWANVLVGRSAFMGTAPGGINSPRSSKTWFAQLQASARRATSAKCGEMAHAAAEVSAPPLGNSLGARFKQYTIYNGNVSLCDGTELFIHPKRILKYIKRTHPTNKSLNQMFREFCPAKFSQMVHFLRGGGGAVGTTFPACLEKARRRLAA